MTLGDASERQPPPLRYPERRFAPAPPPGYLGPLRRKEDADWLNDRQREYERSLLMLRFAMWALGTAAVAVIGYWASRQLG
jgi:hypothetical protein